MNWPNFEIQVPGKWVLTGEHAVLRGATAIALPHPEFGLSLAFRAEKRDDLQVLPSSEAQRVVDDLLGSVRAQWESDSRSAFDPPRGTLEIRSTIPIGAGLGSSAALCVAMARWLAEPLAIPPGKILDFATRLEHRFHGRSSGMDTAVIAAAEPISFVMGRGPRPLGVRRIPRFTFHDTGIRSRTSECVLRVGALTEEEPVLALRIDGAMGTASLQAMEGLVRYDSGSQAQGLELIAQSMRQAQECFYDWRLVPGEGKRLQEDLLGQGALAVKMTGAGGGGMMVALWGDGTGDRGDRF